MKINEIDFFRYFKSEIKLLKTQYVYKNTYRTEPE